MPEWNWFAFDSNVVSKSVLEPAQKAVRERDLSVWQDLYDFLSQTHTRPYLSNLRTKLSPHKGTIFTATAGANTLTHDEVPEETSFPLRRALQIFVEQLSLLTLEGDFPRPQHWIRHEIDWSRFVASDAEREELRHFMKEIAARKEKLPDPFWCLESNSAVDSNYITPQAAAEMAEIEAKVGLFRELPGRTDPTDESHALAKDMAAAMLFVQLAALKRLGIYFREDGT